MCTVISLSIFKKVLTSGWLALVIWKAVGSIFVLIAVIAVDNCTHDKTNDHVQGT